MHHLQAPLDHTREFLSDSEFLKLSTLRFPKRRDEWLLARWAAKSLAQSLSSYRHYPLNEIEIHNTPEGVPYILQSGGAASPDYLTISHSDRFALCAISQDPAIHIGIDLENIEPRTDAFVEDYFTLMEQKLVEFSPLEIRQTVINLIWSTKESMLKALGVGLHWDLRKVEVRQIDGILTFDVNPYGWQKMQIGDPQCGGRQWAGWWQCRNGFILTLAGFTIGLGDFHPAVLVEKRIEMV